MTTSLLPAFGWSEHSEQIDAAALAARAWQISTKLIGGTVSTGQVPAPSPQYRAQLEAIAKHTHGCKNPNCLIGLGLPPELFVDGKLNEELQLFFTTARTLDGRQLFELCAIASSPEEATKNHYVACALLTGALSNWDVPTPSEKPT